MTRTTGKLRRSPWAKIGITILCAISVLSVVMTVLVYRAGSILKGRVIETLSTRFDSKVELDKLNVLVLHGLEVSGEGLRIFPPDDVMAAGATQPLIAIRHFTFHAGLFGLLFKPTHVNQVHVTGLQINIPPREMRQQGVNRGKYGGKTKIILDEIVCNDSQLIISTAKPGKDPKQFELQHIVLHDVGPNKPWPYDATLTNAVPRGDIHAVGTFGPWNQETPGDSSVSGKYRFDHADLNTIKGIGGILSSGGGFTGRLNRIEVQGTTETPDFSLDTANRPMPLHTQFYAIVDGTSGDTYLNQVEAKLGESDFNCRGTVINVKGKGHIINLDVYVPAARIQDFLELAVKTEPVVMTGVITARAKLNIHPGNQSVSQRMSIRGVFTLRRIHFVNPQVQDKVDMLSLRAQGDPKKAKPGAQDVSSRMTGIFVMRGGEMRFRDLNYVLPGATVQLAGVYSLDGRRFLFTGKLRTNAKLSQMVASGWKSWMLKVVDPFFHKNGAGAELPVKITGTKSAPKFGLNFHR